MSRRFHFTFGPVQSFVAQARRTRDLWAGSWLLSYLAKSAIAAAEEAGARMILPHRKEADRGSVTMTSGDRLASFGGFPNRFTAGADNPVAAARAAERGLRVAWERIADAVWDRFVAGSAEMGAGTREIWDRQVGSYWETAWVVGEADALAARKNVRLVEARVEPGDHCSLMDEFQELSGHVGLRARGRQKNFWAQVRSVAGISDLDLEEGERLCAIALIKRFFPYVGDEAVGSNLTDMRGWPSTAWLAASPWIERAMTSAAEAATDYTRSLGKLRWEGSFRGEREAACRRFGDRGPQGFAALDGPLYFDTALGNPVSLDNLEEGQDPDPPIRLLRALYEQVGASPEPFYAVLLMDGDRMGELLGRARGARPEHGEKIVSDALGRFAQGVDGSIRKYNGYTVYAGGDDLLGLLPADTALDSALELESAYRTKFASVRPAANGASISGALVFAHYRAPLRGVLRYGHHLLDNVAKERTGRGALAVGIVQSSGVRAEWAAPWEVVRGEEPGGPVALSESATAFGDQGLFNSTYLYHLRGMFERLAPEAHGGSGVGLEDDVMTAIAAAEYRRSDKREPVEPVDKEVVKRLVALLRRWQRKDGRVEGDRSSFTFNGVRVATFLARVRAAATATAEFGRR